MYGAPLSKDLNLPIHPQPAAAGVRTPPQMSSSGLLRYRSAPSTLLGEVCGDFLPANGAGAGHRPDHAADSVLADHDTEIRDSKPPRPAHFPEDATAMTSQRQFMCQSQQQQQMAAMEGLYRTVSSGDADPAAASSLLRQSSSPAGFINHLGMENGYGNMLRTGMGGGAPAFRNGDARLKGQLSVSSRQGSVMSQISEMVSEELGGGSSPEAVSNGGYGGIPGGYPMSASSGWDDGLSGAKRPRDGGPGRQLKQQLSLPSGKKGASPEMAAIEKFLQFQDAVPCKIRAKRGCATHPRSIAERVRRTRISERIRKLQELVPNMEKQTNTADMLDLAVDYIKELQMQAKVLKDSRACCTCSASRQKQFAS